MNLKYFLSHHRNDFNSPENIKPTKIKVKIPIRDRSLVKSDDVSKAR